VNRNHISLSIFPSVYEPAEDSFLLADYASSLHGKILEIGCGSGLVCLSAASADQANEVLGVDINPEAVKCSQENARANGIYNTRFIESDMFSNITGKFDVILFNPPYLPTAKDEHLGNSNENAAYDGGKSGYGVFLKFSKAVPKFIAPGGKVAVVATSLNGGIEKTRGELEKLVGESKIISQESFFFEKIALVEAVKKD
jgi:release factor glutamine methyltransferase